VRIGVALVFLAVALTGASPHGIAAGRAVSSGGADESAGLCYPADEGTCPEVFVAVPSRVSLNQAQYRPFRSHRHDPFARATRDAPRLAVLTRLAAEGRKPLFPNWRRRERLSVNGTPFPERMSRFADLSAPLSQSARLLSMWTADPLRWGAVQESMLATSSDCPCLVVASPGQVPDGNHVPGNQLLLTKNTSDPNDIDLRWDLSCLSAADDYAVQEGKLGSWNTHMPRTCTTGGWLDYTLTPDSAGRFYLIVPLSPKAEGSYGTDSMGTQRPPSASSCRPRIVVDPCP